MKLLALQAVFAGPLGTTPLLESIRDTLSTGPGANEIVAFVAGFGAFVLLIVLAARFFGREHSTTAEPQVDYLTLAVDVIGLSESDRRDLQRIAREAELEQPAALLLSPLNLARAAAPILGAEGDEELRPRLEDLCVRLFDTPLPDPRDLAGQPS